VAHLARRATLAGQSGDLSLYAGWSRYVDMLGFRGHFATKSHRYSTTLGRLRQVRRDYTRSHHRAQTRSTDQLAEVDQDQVDGEDTTLVIGSWRYAGMGWLTTADAALAMASAARARDD
jgi:excisionase family DNA binding protein